MRSISALLFLLAIATIASAQNSEPSIPRTLAKVSPQHFINNSLKIGLERFNSSFTKSFVLFITPRVEGSNSGDLYRRGYNGVGAELQYRKYISPMREHITKRRSYYGGIYAAGFAQAGSYTGKFKGESGTYDWRTGIYTSTPYDYKEDVGNWAVGFTLGYHRTFWDVVYIDGYIGGGVQFSDSIKTGTLPNPDDIYVDIVDPGFHGILPKFGILIGISL